MGLILCTKQMFFIAAANNSHEKIKFHPTIGTSKEVGVDRTKLSENMAINMNMT